MRLGKEKKVAKQRRRKRCRSWPRCPTRVGRSRRSELVQRRECGVEVLAEAGVDGDARPLGPWREIWTGQMGLTTDAVSKLPWARAIEREQERWTRHQATPEKSVHTDRRGQGRWLHSSPRRVVQGLRV